MNTKLKAAIVLAVLSPMLSELLSGNSPAPIFFNPGFFLLQVFSYGIPVLIFRELIVKWKLSLFGMFVMAVGYGIFNEGLLTGTFFLKDAGVIANYGYFFGVNWPWVGFAMIWHGLHAILYPILIVHVLFPQVSSESWFSGKVWKILAVLAILESVVFYFAPERKLLGEYFVLFWAIIIFCIVVAKRFVGTIFWEKVIQKKSVMILGFSTILFYLGLIAISKTTASLLVYFFGLAMVAYLYWKYLKKKNWNNMPTFLFFILGDYTAVAVFAAIGRPFPIVFFTGIAAVIWLYWLARKASKNRLLS